MLAIAVGRITQKQEGKMRSLVKAHRKKDLHFYDGAFIIFLVVENTRTEYALIAQLVERFLDKDNLP